MSKMTPERLAGIKARAEAATPGPWECRIDVGSRFYVNAPSYGVRDFCCLSGGFERREDAELTAHARTDIPDLIAEVERLRAELAEAHSYIYGDCGATENGGANERDD